MSEPINEIYGSFIGFLIHQSVDLSIIPNSARYDQLVSRDMRFIDEREIVSLVSDARPIPLAEEFSKLVKQWTEETAFLSSLSKIYMHPAYQRIIAMGTEGLPFVLRELQKGDGNWFYALKYMAGEDISEGMDYDDARSAWLEWGYAKNYI